MIAVFVTDTASANYTVYSQIGKNIHFFIYRGMVYKGKKDEYTLHTHVFTPFRREWRNFCFGVFTFHP